MSVVTGIMVFASLAESPKNILALDEWLLENEFSELHPVDDFCCNGKHPQVHMRGGGYNYFKNKEFVLFFLGIKWDYPDTVLLVLHPEEGPIECYRPNWA